MIKQPTHKMAMELIINCNQTCLVDDILISDNVKCAVKLEFGGRWAKLIFLTVRTLVALKTVSRSALCIGHA